MCIDVFLCRELQKYRGTGSTAPKKFGTWHNMRFRIWQNMVDYVFQGMAEYVYGATWQNLALHGGKCEYVLQKMTEHGKIFVP